MESTLTTITLIKNLVIVRSKFDTPTDTPRTMINMRTKKPMSQECIYINTEVETKHSKILSSVQSNG